VGGWVVGPRPQPPPPPTPNPQSPIPNPQIEKYYIKKNIKINVLFIN